MHSDYDRIAGLYDCEHQGFIEDIEFYLQEISGGPVLEVGAGTARIAVPLARSGLDVWAVEPSAAMLGKAVRRAEGVQSLHLVHAALSDAVIPELVRVGIIPLNVLWHFAALESQVDALRRVRAMMLTGGRIIVDCSNPLSMADAGADGRVRQRFRGDCDGQELTVWSAAWDNPGEQRLSLALTYDVGDPVRRTSTTLDLRYVFAGELELMLRLAGFSRVRLFGSYSREEYTSDSPNLIAVAAAG